MLVIKKINNNVAVCADGNGRELIAIGKGIGFPATPYTLTDLSKIDRTFYSVDEYYYPLLNSIPDEIISFAAREVALAQTLLPYETNDTLILALADHLAFAIERTKKGVFIPMPALYELEIGYPQEVKVGRRIVSDLEREFKTRLAKGEVQGVAMHFINARNTPRDSQPRSPDNLEARYEEILERFTEIIEQEIGIEVRRDTFSYARFATHVLYLLRRVMEEKHIDSENVEMYVAIRDEYRSVSACVDKMECCLKDDWNTELTEEEKLYLIMHVNRVRANELE